MAENSIDIRFPDGSTRSYPRGTTGMEVASSISEGLARAALAIRVNGEVRDLTRPIEDDASIEILTWNDPDGKRTY